MCAPAISSSRMPAGGDAVHAVVPGVAVHAVSLPGRPRAVARAHRTGGRERDADVFGGVPGEGGLSDTVTAGASEDSSFREKKNKAARRHAPGSAVSTSGVGNAGCPRARRHPQQTELQCTQLWSSRAPPETHARSETHFVDSPCGQQVACSASGTNAKFAHAAGVEVTAENARTRAPINRFKKQAAPEGVQTPKGDLTMSVHIRGSRDPLPGRGRSTGHRRSRRRPCPTEDRCHLQRRPDRRQLDADGGGGVAGRQQAISRAERAGRAGRGPRQHGEDPQRQGRYRLVDDDRHVRRAEGRGSVRRQADRQGPFRGQLLPQRLAAGGAREQRHQERQGSEGSAGGAAVARQHQPGGRLGVCCSRSTA